MWTELTWLKTFHRIGLLWSQ